MSNVKYMAFPIELLKNAFIDISEVCYNAIRYACYVKYSEIEDIEELGLFFGITLTPYTLDYGKKLFEMYGNSCIIVSVNKGIILDFAKNPKTEFEIAVFCAFCGLRSIIGIEPYKKTTNEFLLSRMFGYRTVDEFQNLEAKPEYYQKYFYTDQKRRYHLTYKIITNELEANWGLKYYSPRSRGFWVSFKLDLKVLVNQVEQRKKKVIDKKRRDEKRLIIEEVIHNLHNS